QRFMSNRTRSSSAVPKSTRSLFHSPAASISPRSSATSRATRFSRNSTVHYGSRSRANRALSAARRASATTSSPTIYARDFARGGQHVLADGTQHRVPRRVAERVVEALEVVDVDHHHAEGLAAAPGAALFPSERLFEVAAVMQTGQPVMHNLVLQAEV